MIRVCFSGFPGVHRSESALLASENSLSRTDHLNLKSEATIWVLSSNLSLESLQSGVIRLSFY
jgi:hypothetical protein